MATKRTLNDLITNIIIPNGVGGINALDHQDAIATTLGTNGGIIWNDNLTDQTFTADTYAKVINASANMSAGSGVTADYVNSRLVMPLAGVYKVWCSFGASADTPQVLLHAAIYVNGVESDIEIDRHLSTAADLGACALSGLLSVGAGEAVELWFKSDKTADIVVKHAQLWAELGG